MSILSDSFTGTNGDPLNSSNWTEVDVRTGAFSEIQGNQALLNAGTITGYGGKIGILANIAARKDADVTIKFMYDASEAYFRIQQRDTISGVGQYGYSVELFPGSSGNIKLFRLDNFNPTQIGTDQSFTISASTEYKVRWQINGANQKMKIWAASGSEPGTWNLFEFTDGSNYDTAGYIIFSCSGGSAANGQMYLDDALIDPIAVDVNVTPSVISSTTTIFAPSPSAGTSVSPTGIAAATTIPTTTPSAGQAASVSPSVISAVATVNSVTVVAGADVEVMPDVILGSTTVNSVTVETGTGVEITPDVIAGSTVVNDVTVATGQGVSITPTTIDATTTIFSHSHTIDVTLSPATIECATTLSEPAISASCLVIPDPLLISASVLSASLSAGIGLSPALVDCQSIIYHPIVSALRTSSTTGGGWSSLLSILKERQSPTYDIVDCPNDGTLLQTGPDGQLFCPFDGWRA